MLLALNALVGWIWGTNGRVFPKIFGGGHVRGRPRDDPYQAVGALTVLAIEVVLLYLLFQKTKLGLAMRSVTSNTESSRLVGIRVGRVLMFGWGLAAAVGALGRRAVRVGALGDRHQRSSSSCSSTRSRRRRSEGSTARSARSSAA